MRKTVLVISGLTILIFRITSYNVCYTKLLRIQGMTSEGYQLLTGVIVPYADVLAAAGGSTFYWEKSSDGNYVPAYFNGDSLGNNMMSAWKLAREMYSEGTIETDIALTSTQQADDKFLQGQSAARNNFV